MPHALHGMSGLLHRSHPSTEQQFGRTGCRSGRSSRLVTRGRCGGWHATWRRAAADGGVSGVFKCEIGVVLTDATQNCRSTMNANAAGKAIANSKFHKCLLRFGGKYSRRFWRHITTYTCRLSQRPSKRWQAPTMTSPHHRHHHHRKNMIVHFPVERYK